MPKPVGALVIGGGRAALATVRALGRRGIPVTVAEHAPHDLAVASRYAVRGLKAPDPFLEAEGLANMLRREEKENPGSVWIPVSDAVLEVVDGLRGQAPEMRLPFPSSAVLELAWDRWKLAELASVCGFLVPRARQPAQAFEAAEAAREFGFPVLLKPPRPRLKTKNGFRAERALLAGTQAELLAAWRREREGGSFPIVQEHISGREEGWLILAAHGVEAARFAYGPDGRPPSWDAGRRDFPQSLREPLERFLRALGWHGACRLELRVDSRDGRTYLMGASPSFQDSPQSAVDAGSDIPFLQYRLALGERVEPGLYGAGLSGKSGIFRWDDPRPAWKALSKYISKKTRESERKNSA